jgi:hypothetical protein
MTDEMMTLHTLLEKSSAAGELRIPELRKRDGCPAIGSAMEEVGSPCG